MELFEDNLAQQAKSYELSKHDYEREFLELLRKIYDNYRLLIKDKVKVPKDENKIRNILVDNYLSKNILDYDFIKEEKNNLGRVDIFIQENIDNEPAEFIIECKLLDNKNINGKDGLNGKYITNGILRFLTEHYYLSNNFNINAMIGFVVVKMDIDKNIEAINMLTKITFKNIVEIKKAISLFEPNIYDSAYQTGKPEKDFYLYHLMMDFSNNIKSK